MPRFVPFAGYRYDRDRVDLDSVVAPPYDVVGPGLRADLAARHPANAIRVELPQPDASTGADRYRAAATLLAEWIDTGLLRRDPTPVFYGYRMTAVDGSTTLGVLGLLGLDRASSAATFPHEATLARAKSDRLELLTATRFNLSPIWGLTLASGLGAHVVPPDDRASTVDDDGILHELWAVTDPAAIEAVSALVDSAPLVIADGHHRLATAVAYRDGAGAGTPGSDEILALVVELTDEQLSVGPIHRLLSGLPESFDVVAAFARRFDIEAVDPSHESTGTAVGDASMPTLLTPAGCWSLRPRPGTAEDAGSDLWPAMIALVMAELPDHRLEFANSRRAAAAAVADGDAQTAVLLPPIEVSQIRTWAEARRQMPPKSTYFHPKPRTGMVFRSLDPA